MKLNAVIFLIAGLFLSACGYELPKTAKQEDNPTTQTNQNAKNQSNQVNNAINAGQVNKSNETNTGSNTGETKLTLSGTSESATYACNGSEVEVGKSTTGNSYTLTGECKKITVDGVSNTVNVDKVGEIVVAGVSNKVIYGEGLGGKKPKITKSGTSTFVESLEEKKKSEANK